jgi:hypothetical protein
MGNPLSTQFMQSVVELRPTKAAIKEGYIGQQFLPFLDIDDYTVIWDAVKYENPMAGFFALEATPRPGQDLDFETFKSDVMHSSAMRTLLPKDIQGPREAGEAHIRYGTGWGAEYFRKKNARKVSELTQWSEDALDTHVEYLSIHSLLGRIWWPPKDADGNDIAAAAVPVHWGDIKVNFPVPFLEAAGGLGGFEQEATTLASGITGGLAAQGVAWNTDTGTEASSGNMIRDMEVIGQLLNERQGITPNNLEVLMSRLVLSQQAFNTNLLNWVFGDNKERRDNNMVPVNQMKDFISTKFDWRIRTYDAQWTYVAQNAYGDNAPTVNRVRFLPVGTVLILPRPEISEMGNMATAPAPGAARQWQNGRYFWMDNLEKPPWTTEMGMGMYVWPLVYQVDTRFRLNSYD